MITESHNHWRIELLISWFVILGSCWHHV